MQLAEVYKILKGPIQIEKVRCKTTGFSVEGPFSTPALYQIDASHCNLVELLVIHGGNLKRVAEELDISYPTLKNRLDEIADILQTERRKAEKERLAILEEIEKGHLSPEKAGEKMRGI